VKREVACQSASRTTNVQGKFQTGDCLGGTLFVNIKKGTENAGRIFRLEVETFNENINPQRPIKLVAVSGIGIGSLGRIMRHRICFQFHR